MSLDLYEERTTTDRPILSGKNMTRI